MVQTSVTDSRPISARDWWIWLAAIAISAAFSGMLVWGGAVFLQWILALLIAGLVPVMLIVLIFGGGVLGRPESRDRVQLKVFRVCIPVLLFAFTQLFGCSAGWMVLSARVAAAQRWCEAVASRANDWRKAHGRYPASLDELELDPDRPKLCEDGLIYSVYEDGVGLDFGTGMWVEGWSYHSGTRVWTYYN